MKHWQRINLQNIQAAHAANTRKTNNPTKKWAKDLNRRFSKEDIQMANKHIKNAQHCLFLGKFKTKLPWGITSHWSKWLSLKNLQTNAGEDMKKEPSCTVGGNSVIGYSHYGEQYRDSLKI